MAKIPDIPIIGQQVKASHLAEIIRWVRSIVPRGDGKTCRVKTTEGGSIISSFGGSGDSQLSFCFLKDIGTRTTANSTDFDLGRCYIGDVIEDGVSQTATESNVEIMALGLPSNTLVDYLSKYPNAYLPCFKSNWTNWSTNPPSTELRWTVNPHFYPYNGYFRTYYNINRNITTTTGLAIVNTIAFNTSQLTISDASVSDGIYIYLKCDYIPGVETTDEFDVTTFTEGTTLTPVMYTGSLPATTETSVSIPIAIIHKTNSIITEIEQIQHGVLMVTHVAKTKDDAEKKKVDDENAQKEEDAKSNYDQEQQDQERQDEAGAYCATQPGGSDNSTCVQLEGLGGTFETFAACQANVGYGETCEERGYGPQCGSHLYPCTQNPDETWEFTTFICCTRETQFTNPEVGKYYAIRGECYTAVGEDGCSEPNWNNDYPGCCAVAGAMYLGDDTWQITGGNLTTSQLAACHDRTGHRWGSCGSNATHMKFIGMAVFDTAAEFTAYTNTLYCTPTSGPHSGQVYPSPGFMSCN